MELLIVFNYYNFVFCVFGVIIESGINLKGKDVHAVDAYVVVTWLPPLRGNPSLSLPVSDQLNSVIEFDELR